MTLRRQFHEGRLTLQAVAADGALLGHVVQRLAADESEIEWIEVSAAERRRGHGRTLMQEAMRAAAAAGARTMYLEVRASNLAAQGLYQALGFEVCGRREAYYTAPTEAAVLWRRDLSGFNFGP
ncbi:MAG: GNAT family N-acetyltransferase [Terriglobales bacterium]